MSEQEQQQTNEQNQPEPTPTPQSQPETQPESQTRSSSELEAENRALRAILSGQVDGINIDEELEYVGPTGKYRPATRPQAEVAEQRTSRRQGLQNTRAEDSGGVDIAAIDKEFDNYLKTAYGFDMGGGQDA